MKRPIDKQLVIVSLGIGIGLMLIGFGLSKGSTGRQTQGIPAEIENMSPGPGDQVLRQSQIYVDFIDGYNAALTIDGVELETTRLDELTANGVTPKPGAQVDMPATAIYDPGNYIISFLPQQGAPIENLQQGAHSASVRYWKITDGPTKARIFKWTFEAN